MMELKYGPRKGIWVEEPASFEKLHRNHFGTNKKGKLFLEVEEALYALNFLRGTCLSKKGELGFNDVAAIYAGENPRLFVMYNAYRDWRDRGLILLSFSLARPQESPASPPRP